MNVAKLNRNLNLKMARKNALNLARKTATGANGPSHFAQLGVGFAAGGLAWDEEPLVSSSRTCSLIQAACLDFGGRSGKQASQRSRAACKSPCASSERA